MSSASTFPSEDPHAILSDVDQFVDEEGQLNVEQIEKYLSNEEQSPDSFLGDFENNGVQSINVADDMDFGEFVGGGHVPIDNINKIGMIPPVIEPQLVHTAAPYTEIKLSPGYQQHCSPPNFNYGAVDASQEHGYIAQPRQYVPTMDMKAATNKKRKIDAETSLPAPLTLKNQMPQYPHPGHNQNNFHNGYSPKYGDSISPASSGISQCNQTNDSVDTIDGISLGPQKGSINHQCINWEAYHVDEVTSVYDYHQKEVLPISFRVDADKGFNFSCPDGAFVCQKKNHFQLTITTASKCRPVYAKSENGSMIPIHKLYVDLYGIKAESPDSIVRVEQSQSDRSKKPYEAIEIDLNTQLQQKTTLGRLHFSETTANNMRKKGKPNPDQRYFFLVVALHAELNDHSKRLIAAQKSERIIIRASNPGQFESDGDSLWSKGPSPDTVVHMGHVGINTQAPDEALVVHGNVKVTGHITHPSDERVKHEVRELIPAEQLKNVETMKVVQFKYKQNFACPAGLDPSVVHTGVIAQQMKEVIPEAVIKTEDVVLANGEKVDGLMVVNKDRIYMENVGAVKELCKLTGNLENRISQLESTGKKSSKGLRRGSSSSTATRWSRSSTASRKSTPPRKSGFFFTHSYLHMIMAIFILVMLLCIGAIVTLYILHLQRDDTNGEMPGTLNKPTDSIFASPSSAKSQPVPTAENIGTWHQSPTIKPPHNKSIYTIKCCSDGNDGSTSTINTSGTPKPTPEKMDTSNSMGSMTNNGGLFDLTNAKSPRAQIVEGNIIIQSQVNCLSCGPSNYSYYLPMNSTTALVPVTIKLSFAKKMELLFCGITESEATCCGTAITPPRYDAHEFRFFHANAHQTIIVPAPFFLSSCYTIRAFSSTKHGITCESPPGIDDSDFVDFIFYFNRRTCA